MAHYCPQKDEPVLYLDCQECEEQLCRSFFCMIIGSRTFNNYELLKRKCDHLLQKKTEIVIISGGANGTDALAKRYAEEKGFAYKEFPADWSRYGKRAGYIRNRIMHEYLSKQKSRGVIAFWDGKSKGTAHSFELAKEFDNPIRVVRV